jgi:3-hydroxyisobutyrate dehydrogenase-like beta-hydroxyacid dehydrogenase
MMQKDMTLALDMGRELNVPLPTTTVTSDVLTAARAAGLSNKDFAAVFQLLARMSGVKA